MTNTFALRTSIALFVSLGLMACTFEPAPGGSPGSPSDPSTPVADDACTKDRDIVATETWSPETCPAGYRVARDLAVTGVGVELHVKPGTMVRFDGGAGLRIEGGAAIDAQGTADQKITFDGYDGAAPGAWLGIAVITGSTHNVITNAIVKNAGAGTDVNRDAAIQVGMAYGDEAGLLKLSSTSIVSNARFGLRLQHDAHLAGLDGVELRDNTAGLAHVEAPAIGQLAGTNMVWGAPGADNVVWVETDILIPINDNMTWPRLENAIYRVVGQNLQGGDEIRVNRVLTIEAGTTIELAGGSSSGFLVEGGTSGLVADGTTDKPIVLRGVNGSAWGGVTFGESTNASNLLRNVKIANASAAPEWQYYATGADTAKASVLLGYNGATPVQLKVENVSFAGPFNAAADIAKKSACNLVLAGTNVGAAGAAVVVEEL